jgi:hypothetical protein
MDAGKIERRSDIYIQLILGTASGKPNGYITGVSLSTCLFAVQPNKNLNHVYEQVQ